MSSKTKEEISKFPKKIFLGIMEGTCNLNCPKCYIFGNDYNKRNVPKGQLTLEQVDLLLQEIKNEDISINPTTWSEFLLPKNALKYLTLINSYDIPMSVNSNGFLITKDIAKFLIELPFDSINISVDATTSQTLRKTRGTEKLEELKNIILMLLKERGNKLKPRIGVSFTHESANYQEKDEFIEYWLNYVDVIRVNSMMELGSHSTNQLTKKLPSKRIPCPALYDDMLINCKGDVPICCYDSMCENSMGNVFQTSIKDVWNGEKFNAIRKLHENEEFDKIDLCKNCDAWSENIFYEKEETDNLIIKRSYTTEFYNRKDKLSTLANNFGKKGLEL